MARPSYLDKINAEIRKAKKRNQKKLPPKPTKKKSNVIGKPLNVAKGGGVGGLVKAKPKPKAKAKAKANGKKANVKKVKK